VSAVDDPADRPIAAADPVPGGFGLPRTARLRSERDFKRTYQRGVRVRGNAMTIVASPRQAPAGRTAPNAGDHRLGVSVSKDHGRAVRRNKIKRLLREAFRLERPTLPGSLDLVLIPNRRDGRYELADLRAELARGVVRALESLAGRRADDDERGRRRRGGRSRRGDQRRGEPRRGPDAREPRER
jgi:ribonuclease P protein component